MPGGRDGLGDHKSHRITTHLDRCADCRKLADGLKELNAELPATVSPLILGVPVVAHWLTTGGTVASSGIAAGTGASALSWATAAKVAAASAALVTTVTIGAGTSDTALPPPATGADGSSTQQVRTRPATRAASGDDHGQPSGPADRLTSVPAAPPSEKTAAGEQSEATGDGGTATKDKQAKQAAKESKQAAKESKQAAKEEKKADKTKSSKPEKTKEPKK
ncbi:hypothetical protein [Amycolatopsis vastitatis]|uniref:hypothetical protein n=1 Tax=Amycolatopsis vastitatis TaxID=1905142 RepID=UPI001F0A6793|nr:hypothetical protein [Amycolatopsis vastitatis]